MQGSDSYSICQVVEYVVLEIVTDRLSLGISIKRYYLEAFQLVSSAVLFPCDHDEQPRKLMSIEFPNVDDLYLTCAQSALVRDSGPHQQDNSSGDAPL